MIVTNKNKSLSQNILNQIDSIVEKGSENKTLSKSIPSEKRKVKNADTINLVLPKGERAKFKSFCSEYSLSMTEFFFMCADVVRSMVQDKEAELSRSGIKFKKI